MKCIIDLLRVCVCVCVCVTEADRQRQYQRGRSNKRIALWKTNGIKDKDKSETQSSLYFMT